MNILKSLTEFESDLAAKDAMVIAAAEATHHLASVLANVHRAFWSLPTERLLAVLNADVEATLATFAANTALGTAANASLDALALPRFPARAPLTLGREDVYFDSETGVFCCRPSDPVDPLPPP